MNTPELSVDLLEHKQLKLSILARIDNVKNDNVIPMRFNFSSFEDWYKGNYHLEYNRYIIFSYICHDKRYKPAYAELNKADIVEMLKAFKLFNDSKCNMNIPAIMTELIYKKPRVELKLVYKSGQKYIKLSLYSDSQVFDIDLDSEDVKIIRDSLVKGQSLGNAMIVELKKIHSKR